MRDSLLQVLLMIQAVAPVLTVGADHAWKLLQRCYVMRFTSNAAQDQYNEAYARPNFNLQQRVADVMLNVSPAHCRYVQHTVVHTMPDDPSTCVVVMQVTVALMFGSGMPLCYIIAVGIFLFTILVERYALIKLCGIANRYSRQLPDAIIGGTWSCTSCSTSPPPTLAHMHMWCSCHSYCHVPSPHRSPTTLGGPGPLHLWHLDAHILQGR
jgi:hypothetical protein